MTAPDPAATDSAPGPPGRARLLAARRWAPPWDSDEFDAYDVFEADEAA
ncbi:hypothetical protein OHS18_19155 [Amycolatopsis sp. NBC_00355]